MQPVYTGVESEKAREDFESEMATSERASTVDSPAQTSSFQSYTFPSPTPLDLVSHTGEVTITVGGCKKKPEACTVTELKHWLKNRRSLVGQNILKVTGNKPRLIERVQNAVRAGVVPTMSAAPSSSTPLPVPVKLIAPLAQWSDDSALLMVKAPVVSEDLLFTHLQTGTGNVAEANAFRALTERFRLLQSNFVLQLLLATDDHTLTWIKGVVRATMRNEKRFTYTAFADGNIVYAKYSCPAGLSGCCVHVSVTLWALNKLGPSRGPSTSQPCSWNEPAKKTEPARVQDLHIQRHDPAKQEKRQRQPLHDFDPRPMHMRAKTDRFQKLCARMAAIDRESGSTPSNITTLYVPDTQTLSPTVDAQSPLEAILEAGRSDLLACSIDYVERNENCPDLLSQHMVTSQETRLTVAAETVEQSSCLEWFQHRKNRITASIAHRIKEFKGKREPTGILKVLQTSTILPTGPNDPRTWGKINEPVALEEYKRAKNSSQTTPIRVFNCGFVIHKYVGWIGATPDAIIHDPQSQHSVGLAEVKCPYSTRNMTIQDAIQQCPSFCLQLSDELQVPALDRKHAYYTQIQTQLAVTNKAWCDFIIYTKQDIHIERIHFDPDFWQDTFHKLSLFYAQYVLPTCT